MLSSFHTRVLYLDGFHLSWKWIIVPRSESLFYGESFREEDKEEKHYLTFLEKQDLREKQHWQAVHRILHHFKATPWKGILFKRGKELNLEAYTDADYAGLSEYGLHPAIVPSLRGNLLTWRSKKQTVVALSSLETDFRAMVHGICELLWLKIILDDLKIKRKALRNFTVSTNAISIPHILLSMTALNTLRWTRIS